MPRANNRPIPILSARNIARFHSQVDKRGVKECWPWTGSIDQRGYGKFFIIKGKRSWAAHRVAYFIQTGIDPGDNLVCHSCDNPPCCNSLHHFLGSDADNASDKVRKHRQATGDKITATRILPKGDQHWTRMHPERTPLSFREGSPLGEAHGNATLTNLQVTTIRRKYADGVSQQDLAREFGIQRSAISKIVLRKRWKHIP